ncbi:hypothetical protein C8Q70DRAFT_420516 [Cubamyces menziesii]|nr:hypothetical protein C8Q70DRAFT_420516 [Cubamyces menziesii]
MATHHALNNGDILYCILSVFNSDRFDYRSDEPRHSERARREALAHCALVCKTFRDIALPVLWARLHNLAPFFRLLSTCTIVGETSLGSRMSAEHIYALGSSSVSQEEIERLRYYGALIRIVAWNHKAAPDTPGYYDYIDGSSLKQLRLVVGDAQGPLLPNLDTLSWARLTLTMDPASLSVLMSPDLKTLRMNSVFDKGEWQPLIERLLLASLPTAPNLEHLHLDYGAYYSELRLSSEITYPISKLRSLRSLTLLFPTHQTWNEIRSNTVLDALQQLAPLRNLERLEFRPGHIVGGSTASTSSSHHDVLFPNLHRLKLHVVSCGSSSRILFEALRTPSLRSLEATLEYHTNTAAEEAFTTMARCFPNLQSLGTSMSHDDDTWDDWPSPLTEVISPLFTVRSIERLVILAGLRPQFTVGDADLDAIYAAWPHLRVLDLATFPPPMPSYEVEWEDIGMFFLVFSRPGVQTD